MHQLVESGAYSAQLSTFGSIERVDDALMGVTWAISKKPDDFAIVAGTTSLRVAKTEQLSAAGGKLQRLRVWFRIVDDNSVDLLYIDTQAVVPK